MKKLLDQYRRKQILNILKNTSPKKFESIAEKKLFIAVSRSLKISPAYRDITKNKIQGFPIKTLKDFTERIPILTKSEYFEKYSLDQLLGKHKEKMKYAMSSSGYSGNFGYGFSSEKAFRKSRMGVDATFDYVFDISNRKTFLINCAPLGVHVETSLPLAETSVRSDMVIALLKKISPEYDQTIIGGDPYFLKKLVEEADDAGIDWEKLQVSLITAQDYLPESLRTYLYNRLGINPESPGNRGIFATMGMTELGLNVFHESKFTVAIRRTLLKDDDLRELLCPSVGRSVPCIFHYYPFRTYIESIRRESSSELIFSVVDPENILPIIRYSTGDSGEVISYTRLANLLSDRYPGLIPDLKLPIGFLFGRTNNRYMHKGAIIRFEDIKEGLFANQEVASCITGLIKVDMSADSVSVLVHLKKGIRKNDVLAKKLMIAVQEKISTELEVETVCYDEFPAGLELSYEKKLGS